MRTQVQIIKSTNALAHRIRKFYAEKFKQGTTFKQHDLEFVAFGDGYEAKVFVYVAIDSWPSRSDRAVRTALNRFRDIGLIGQSYDITRLELPLEIARPPKGSRLCLPGSPVVSGGYESQPSES